MILLKRGKDRERTRNISECRATAADTTCDVGALGRLYPTVWLSRDNRASQVESEVSDTSTPDQDHRVSGGHPGRTTALAGLEPFGPSSGPGSSCG